MDGKLTLKTFGEENMTWKKRDKISPDTLTNIGFQICAK